MLLNKTLLNTKVKYIKKLETIDWISKPILNTKVKYIERLIIR